MMIEWFVLPLTKTGLPLVGLDHWPCKPQSFQRLESKLVESLADNTTFRCNPVGYGLVLRIHGCFYLTADTFDGQGGEITFRVVNRGT